MRKTVQIPFKNLKKPQPDKLGTIQALNFSVLFRIVALDEESSFFVKPRFHSPLLSKKYATAFKNESI